MSPYDKQGRYYPPIKRKLHNDVVAALVGMTSAMMACALVMLLGFVFGRSCG